jgi:hypothetical protein
MIRHLINNTCDEPKCQVYALRYQKEKRNDNDAMSIGSNNSVFFRLTVDVAIVTCESIPIIPKREVVSREFLSFVVDDSLRRKEEKIYRERTNGVVS